MLPRVLEHATCVDTLGFGMSCLTKCQIEAAVPFLEMLPDPVLWVRDDYTVSWRNGTAGDQYGKGEGKCFALSHGRTLPCDEDGELCPKQKAEGHEQPVSVVHAHVGPTGEPVMYRVLALPIEGGGVLEIHYELGDELVHDELTGMYRRQFWAEIVRRDQALLSRLDRPYALLFLDLDRFKGFNDSHGHLIGDQLLQALGSTIRGQMRVSDAACRYGGEEFVLFLPNTPLHDAMRFAERVRGEMARVRVDTSAGPQGVTASFGVHGANAREPLKDALQKADDALYRAKQAGRDRVCASSTTTGDSEHAAEH